MLCIYYTCIQCFVVLNLRAIYIYFITLMYTQCSVSYLLLKLFGFQSAVYRLAIWIKHRIRTDFSLLLWPGPGVEVDKYQHRDHEIHSSKLNLNSDDVQRRPQHEVEKAHSPRTERTWRRCQVYALFRYDALQVILVL